MSDKHAAQDALRAQRAYEAYEREWRRKEKEAAEKQAAQEKELREERIKQQKAREYAIAVEAHAMRQEFYENLQRQKQLEEKLKHEELVIADKNKKYAQEVKVSELLIFLISDINLRHDCRPKSLKKKLKEPKKEKNSFWKAFDWLNNEVNKNIALIASRNVKSRYNFFIVRHDRC